VSKRCDRRTTGTFFAQQRFVRLSDPAKLREEAMQKMMFLEPVCVASERDAAGYDIDDLEQALQFLRDWPVNRRGPVYHAAYNACSAARNGYLGVEEARKSLSGFARIMGILRKQAQPAPVAPASSVRSTETAARARA